MLSYKDKWSIMCSCTSPCSWCCLQQWPHLPMLGSKVSQWSNYPLVRANIKIGNESTPLARYDAYWSVRQPPETPLIFPLFSELDNCRQGITSRSRRCPRDCDYIRLCPLTFQNSPRAQSQGRSGRKGVQKQHLCN